MESSPNTLCMAHQRHFRSISDISGTLLGSGALRYGICSVAQSRHAGVVGLNTRRGRAGWVMAVEDWASDQASD